MSETYVCRARRKYLYPLPCQWSLQSSVPQSCAIRCLFCRQLSPAALLVLFNHPPSGLLPSCLWSNYRASWVTVCSAHLEIGMQSGIPLPFHHSKMTGTAYILTRTVLYMAQQQRWLHQLSACLCILLTVA